MKTCLLTINLLIFHSILLAQQQIIYDKICFCSGNETPHNIISYDNNLQILLALKNGLNIKDIEGQNIPYTKSQLKLLQMFDLIEKEDGKYYTKIQILDSVQTFELRNHSKLIANEIFPYLENDIVELVEYLKSTYNSRNEFSILFSYVLDGLIWREFEKLELIHPMESDDNILTWNGYFWMIPFPRDSKCGANTSTKKSTTIYITNGVPWKYMKPLYDNQSLTDQLLMNINDEGKISDTNVIKTFGMYNLFNTNGEVLVPIINEVSQSTIFELSSKISKQLSYQILKSVSITDLVDKYEFRDKETALLIFYHELMWDLISIIEQRGIVERPQILINSENVGIEDMSDLIFFVIKN